MAFDGVPQIHDGPNVSGFLAGQTRTTSAGSSFQLDAGVHPIQVDFQGSATQLNEFAVSLALAPGTGGVISDTILDPGYRLKTSTTDPDGITTTTSYVDATVGPQYGLATATTVGAGTSTALTTSTTYEPPSASTYLRKTGRTLPAGNATAYAYYTGTEGPLAAVCGAAADTPQSGQLQSQVDPAPALGAPAREQQFVYDAAGRRAGRRVQVPEPCCLLAEVHEQVAGLLGGPRAVRVGRHAQDVHVAAFDLHDEEHVHPGQGERAVDVEEVAGQGAGLGA